MDTLCKKNFMLIGCKQFLRKMRWYLANIQSCTMVLINNFEILQVSIAFFSDTVRTEELEIVFCILTHMDTLCKKNFMFLGRTDFREKCDDNLQIFKVAQFVLINNFEILQVSIAFFSNTVRPRNMDFFLYINLYGYSMQTRISC